MDWRGKILWWAARRLLIKFEPRVLAVTGSIAKTSTKAAISQALRAVHPNEVLEGYGNLNTFLGVPLAILGFRLDFYRQRLRWWWPLILLAAIFKGVFGRLPRFIVLEFGADHPGDIELLSKMVKLDLAVITIVGPAHLGNYSDERSIAKEKAKILTALKVGGVGFVNRQDKHLDLYRRTCQEKLIEVDARPVELAESFAFEVARELGLDRSKVRSALAKLERPKGRFKEYRLGAYTLVDDSYNANPLSMAAAFDWMKRLPGRKVAVLGEMRELGHDEAIFHQRIGQQAREVFDFIAGVGELAKNYRGDVWFSDAAECESKIFTYLKEGDSILVKGSHALDLERVANSLREKLDGLNR